MTLSEFHFMTALWWQSEEWDMLALVGVGRGDKKQGNWLKDHFCWPSLVRRQGSPMFRPEVRNGTWLP